MAIYHLTTKPISRGQGRSATAAIAYRSGELVHDRTTDEVFDYTRKRGVEHTEIVLPTAAAKMDINWARDRESLWNAAEVAEKRKDARVAREYEVALPHELFKAQRVELVRGFSMEIANRYGVAVDFAIHAPHRKGDERNHHAHILTTTRQVTATGLGDKASIEWSDTDRAKRGLGASKLEVKAIRERWAVLTNEHLKARGIAARVDHRTLEAQGVDRAPTVHLGPAVSAMQRRGIATEVGRRISLEAASERLAQAAELGRLEREKAEVQKSILDLSGDLKAARREREAESSAAELAPGQRPPLTPDEVQAESRNRWQQDRQSARQSDQPQTLEEIRRQGREDWLKLRAEMARGGGSPAASTSTESQPQALPPAPAAAPPQDLTLEQLKAQGRTLLQGAKQELAAEQERERQRQVELQRERSKGRSRGRGRTPGNDDGPFGWSR